MIQKVALGITLLTFIGITALVALAGSGAGASAAQDATPTPLPPPELGALDLDAVQSIDLAALPVIPEIDDNALRLYTASLDQGRSPHAFAKVGDCMTDNPNFLIPIGAGNYDLGDYAELQRVIDHYITPDLNAFERESQAAAGGFNTASILDSLWANPEFCESGESPLACEFRITQPSVALIMFGTNDVFYLAEDQFDYFMRSIIGEAIVQGTLPIMSTFPLRPEFPEKSVLYNQIVAQIAQDYDVPIINLWQALEDLPNQGIDEEETTHMTAPEDGTACHFLESNLNAGFTVRNLVTLQTLDALLAATDAADAE